MKELLRRLRKNPRLAFELGLASLVINILGLTSSIYSIVVLRRYLAVGLDSTLVTLTVGALLAIIFEFALRNVRSKLAQDLSMKEDREISEAAFAAMSRTSYSQISTIPPEQQREVLAGLGAIQQAYSPNNVLTLFDIPFSFVYLFVLALISPLLAGLAAVLAGISLLSSWRTHKKLREPAKELSTGTAAVGGINSSLISAADSVRLFDWPAALKDKWTTRQNKVEDLRSSILHNQTLTMSFGASSAMLMSMTMMGVGAREVLVGNLSVATLIGGNILAGRALGNINRCAQTLDQFAKAAQALAMLGNVAQMTREKESGTRLESVEGRLELRDVAFMYPGASIPLYESMNLKVDPGQILVVTGANGTGKTTFSKILAGLIVPQRGDVVLDGVNLKQFDPIWLRKQFSFLPQSPVFFDGTLRENICCNGFDGDEERLRRICQEAGLSRFVSTHPDGFEMELADGGRRLPVGMKKRIALARALMSDGQVAVFDEPSEGLDHEGLQSVAAILNSLVKAKKTLVLMSSDPFILNAATMVLDLNSKPSPELKSPDQCRRVA